MDWTQITWRCRTGSSTTVCLDGLRRPNHESTSIQAFCFSFLQPHIEFNKRLMIPLGGQGEEMKKLIAILLLDFASGCLPSYHRSCN
jgi:hypothetical protein